MKNLRHRRFQTRSLAHRCSLALIAGWLIAAPFSQVPALAQITNQTPVVTVSAASYDTAAIAPGAIVAAFGTQLATHVESATTIPLPTSLAGTSIRVKDSAGIERFAPLFFVSPNQINYLVPAETAAGAAVLMAQSGDGTISSGALQVRAVAPSIFTANSDGQGAPAAYTVRVRTDGSQVQEDVFEFDVALNRRRPKAIALGPEGERVFLILFLSGISRAPDPNSDNNRNESVHLLLGGAELTPDYAGAQGALVGLDQMNVEIPRSLLGRGQISLAASAPGATSNLAAIEIGPPPGNAPPTVSGFSAATVLAGQPLSIQGQGFSTVAAENLVRVAGTEARVVTASSTQLSVIVPFGAQSGAVSVRTPQGEGASANPLGVRTSISGLIENTARQPMPGMKIRVVTAGIDATSNAEGSFVLPDVTAGAALVEVDGTALSVSPPYPKVTLKTIVTAQRDNPFSRPIAVQQATGPSLSVGSSGGAAEKTQLRKSVASPEVASASIRIGNVTFDVPDNAAALFPDGATSGFVTLTIVDQSRTPAPLPPGEFSSTIAQLTPFGVKLNPGGKLTFPNPDNFPANATVKLFRFDQTLNSPTIGSFIEAGAATVSADRQRIETATGAITETSYYFVSIARQTTTVIGRVVDADGQTPVRLALVRARGQEAFTDGNGGFVLRDVPVNAANESLTVEASFVRPGGRVDRTQRAGAAVINGVTKITPDLVLPSSGANRAPTVLAAASAVVTQNETRDLNLIVSDPDGDQIGQVTVTGPSFAAIQNGATAGSFTLRLTPDGNTAGSFTLTLRVADNRGATTFQNVAVRVNRAPTAAAQTVLTGANVPKAITLAGSDADFDPLQFTIVSAPARGALSGAAPNLIYTPQAGFSGSDSFSFRTSDSFAVSSPATVSLTVSPAATIIRTIVYRQISDFQSSSAPGIERMKMSADGSKLIFSSFAKKVYTMNTDGTGFTEVFDYATFRTGCPCVIPSVDISANGSRIVWTDSAGEIFVANGDGSNRQRIATIIPRPSGGTEGPDIRLGPRLTADGSRVYFIHGGSNADVAGGYVVDASGANLQQLFSYRQMAQLFNRDPNEFNRNIAFTTDLDISDDGSRLVFASYNFQTAGNLVTFDGTLHRVAEFASSGNNRLRLSRDGGKIVALRAVASEPFDVYSLNFDGSAQRAVLSNVGLNGINLGELTPGGAQALTSVSDRYPMTLVNTDGSGRLDPVIPINCDVQPFNGAGIGPVVSLAADGRRFAFKTLPSGQPLQIWLAEINPAVVADAPVISEMTFSPSQVLANGTTAATVTARVTGGPGGVRSQVCGNSLRNGAYEFRLLANVALFDDGANGGDLAASDGLFTQNQVRRDLTPVDPVVPAQIRAHAIASSLRRVTAVDATPFFVLAQAPTGPAPQLTNLNPTSGLPGIQVTLNGSGFDPTAANNIVLFGNRQARVVSATAAQLAVIVPPDLAFGAAAVTVTANAQTSNAMNFNASPPGVNLLRNGNAEEGTLTTTGFEIVPIPGWTTTSNFTAPIYGIPGCMSSAEGQRVGGGGGYFVGGPNNALSTATQTVDVSSFATAIDAGLRVAVLQAQLAGFETDSATARAEFLNSSGSLLGSLLIGPVSGGRGSFQLRTATGAVPVGTRTIRVSLTASRGTNDSYNDGYFDNVFLGLSPD
jgi:uncharacterized protein (TIGR03437 family)